MDENDIVLHLDGILQEWHPCIRKTVNPKDIYPTIRGLTDSDKQRIEKVLDQEGPQKAVDVILDALRGLDHRSGIISFIASLSEHGYKTLAHQIINSIKSPSIVVLHQALQDERVRVLKRSTREKPPSYHYMKHDTDMEYKFDRDKQGLIDEDWDTSSSEEDFAAVKALKSVRSKFYRHEEYADYDDSSREVQVMFRPDVEYHAKLLKWNFAFLVEELEPQSFPRILHIFYLMADFTRYTSRKAKCVLLLLHILVYHQTLIPEFMNIIGKMNRHVRLKIKESRAQTLHFNSLKLHTCSKCSQAAFLEFLSKIPSIPEDVMIELLQNGLLLPEDLLLIHECFNDEDKWILFKRLIRSRSIRFVDFVEAILLVEERKIDQVSGIVSCLKLQLCEDIKTAYTSSLKDLNDTEAPASEHHKPKINDSTETRKIITVVKLSTNKDAQFEETIVETILERKDIINSKIKQYGKIETAWLGSLFIIFELINTSGREIHLFPSIYLIFEKILEDEKLKQKLQDEDVDLKWDVHANGMTNEEKEICRKKIVIMSNFDRFQKGIGYESFRKGFAEHKIMTEEQFNEKFKIETEERPECTKLFLEFVLRSPSHDFNVFFDLLTQDIDHKKLSKYFDESPQIKSEICMASGGVLEECLQAAGLSAEQQVTSDNCADSNISSGICALKGSQEVDQRKFLPSIKRNSNNNCLLDSAFQSLHIHGDPQINAVVFQIHSETENKFETHNEIKSNVSMVGEGNISIINSGGSDCKADFNDNGDGDQ